MEIFSYVRALLNNASVKDNMFRMGLADDRDCKCGRGIETVEHVLVECEEERESRCKLIKDLEDIWMNSSSVGGLQFNLNLMLAPFFCDKLSVELSEKVLDMLFLFFERLTRNL